MKEPKPMHWCQGEQRPACGNALAYGRTVIRWKVTCRRCLDVMRKLDREASDCGHQMRRMRSDGDEARSTR